MSQGTQIGALYQPRGVGGVGREVGGKFKREGRYVHLWVIHVDVWYKRTKFCKAIILQFKNKLRKSLRFTISTRGMFCLFFKTFKFYRVNIVTSAFFSCK